MILADTSVWIEFLRGISPFTEKVTLLLEHQGILGAEWVFGELLQGARSESDIKTIKNYWINIPHVDTKDIWIAAGELSGRQELFSKGVGLIDAALIAAARKSKARIRTLDKKLLKVLLPHEIMEPKI